MTEKDVRYAREQLLALLGARSGPLSMQEVARNLLKKGVREDALRVVIWRLLDHNTIKLTANRELQAA